MTLNSPSSLHSIKPALSSQLCELSLQNFRCFAYKKLEILQPQLLIIGSNGAGKSSLLEAVYYAGYSHSFRTRLSRQMIKEGATAFNLRLKIQGKNATNEIMVGLGQQKKILKINGVNANSAADVAPIFNCATLTQEDMSLVSLGPENRRSFLNQCQFLTDPVWLELAKKYKKNLDQRNALLASQAVDPESFKIWTLQHWQITRQIQLWRIQFIEKLKVKCNLLLNLHLPEMASEVTINYKPEVDCTTDEFENFFTQARSKLLPREQIMARSLFGAHLDDFNVKIYGRCARSFASRGEQKLLTLLLKCAALQIVQDSGVGIGCLLIDDFLTDLDKNRVEKCQQMIADLNTQTIITMPVLRRDLFEKNSWTQELLFD